MDKTLRGAITRADDIQRMKYLLAKYDLDDLQAALVIIYQHLTAADLNAGITLYEEKIEVYCETDSSHTEISISLEEDKLKLLYNTHSQLELFNKRTECDFKLIEKVQKIIRNLSFYKISESSFSSGLFNWRNETYAIDVIKRKP
ncbi:MAG: hypothetical protein ACM3Q2_18295 [Syntrophothermus sp.]